MRWSGWKFIVLVTCLTVVFLWLVKAPILSVYMTHKMRIPVSISWVGIWPSYTNIHSFKIKNPKGFKNRNALKIKKIECNYRLRQFFYDPITIDQIKLEHITLRVDLIETVGTRNNWTVIGERMPPSKSHRRVVIRKIILDDFTVEIQSVNLLVKPQIRHFDHLEFDEIDNENGFPTEKLIEKIFHGSSIQQYIENLFSPINNVRKLLNPFNWTSSI